MALEHRTHRLGVRHRIATREILRRAGRKSIVGRRARAASDDTRTTLHVEQRERSDRCRLVPAARTMHHERAADTGQARERRRHQLGHRLAVGADQHVGRRGGVGQRTQYIEQRTHTERLTHRSDGLHRGVVMRREQERESGRREARPGTGLIERQRQTQLFEHIGAARAAGDRAIPVLDDGQPASGDQQRGARGDVHTARGIATGADDVDGACLQRRIYDRPAREIAHGPGEATQFVGDDALAAQRREQRTRERRRQRRIGERMERLDGLGLGEIAALEHPLQERSQRLQVSHRDALRAAAGSSPSAPVPRATARSRGGTARPRPSDHGDADP